MYLSKLALRALPGAIFIILPAIAQIEIKATDITRAVTGDAPSEVAARPTGPVPAWFLAGNNAPSYSIGLDSETKHGGANSAHIRCRDKSCGGFGTLMQTFRADEYRGSRIRLSAWVKSDRAGRANLWMRVDGFQRVTLDFDNMQNRPMSGTKDWRRQEVVLDVPPTAASISYGLILSGAGQAWVDDITLNIVDRKVRHTGSFPKRDDGPPPSDAELSMMARMPLRPQNLDFEK